MTEITKNVAPRWWKRSKLRFNALTTDEKIEYALFYRVDVRPSTTFLLFAIFLILMCLITLSIFFYHIDKTPQSLEISQNLLKIVGGIGKWALWFIFADILIVKTEIVVKLLRNARFLRQKTQKRLGW